MFWNFCIDRPVFTTVIFLVVTIFGIYGYNQLPVRLFPEIDFPVVNVSATYEGADPEVIETEVLEPLEEQINTVEGIRELTSTARLGSASVTVRFELDRDIDVAAQDIRDAVARARRSLPDEVDQPRVQKMDPDAQPIMWISLTGDERWDSVKLNRYAEENVVERLQRLQGIANIRTGGSDYAVRIKLDPTKMAARNITAQQIAGRLREENLEVPAGRLETENRQFLIKTQGRYSSAGPINDLVLEYRDGNPIRLGDVGTAYQGEQDPRGSSSFNGKPSAGMGIVRQPDANTVQLADRVLEEMERISEQFPPGVSYDIASDDSIFIEENVNDLQMTVVLATVIVMLVIFVFLQNFRGTLITFFAIPTSFLVGFAGAHLLGFTLNLMTLLGLILVVGIVIDDAIVVIENCHRHQENGASPLPAARVGVTEVAFATIANSLSLAAVFIPIAFTSGLIGEMFYEFGMMVAITIFASTATALSLTAMMSGQFLTVQTSRSGVFEFLENWTDWLNRKYASLLDTSLRWGWTTIGIGVLSLLVGVAFFFGINRAFVPQGDSGQAFMVFQLPQGARGYQVEQTGEKIQQILDQQPEVRAYFMITGEAFGPARGLNSGLSIIRFSHRDERERHQDLIIDELRAKASKIVGADVFIAPSGPGPGGNASGAELQLAIQHQSLDRLDEQQERIVNWMRQQDLYVAPRSDLNMNQPELNVNVDRERASELGISLQRLGQTLRMFFGEAPIGEIEVDTERFDIIPEIAGREAGITPQRLKEIQVRTSEGKMVPLSTVVQLNQEGGPSEINRINRSRSVTLQANLPEGVALGQALDRLKQHLDKTLPPGFDTHVTGQAQELQDAFYNLTIAAMMAIIFIYLVLAAQFESFVHPFTILMTVPLAILGAFFPLWLFDMTFNMFAFIGLILLFGIVTKNGILLVDYMDILRDRGRETSEAALEAGDIRFRPILMTALSTILGLLPVALGYGAGGEIRAPLGVVVSCGMFFSTLLTLVVIPVVYVKLDQFQRYILSFWNESPEGTING